MRLLGSAILFVFALALIATPAMAEGGGKKGGAKAPPATKVTGDITKVDATSITITTKTGETSTDKALTIDASTKITIDGKDATATDLKTGTKAVVTYDNDKALKIVVGDAPVTTKKKKG